MDKHSGNFQQKFYQLKYTSTDIRGLPFYKIYIREPNFVKIKVFYLPTYEARKKRLQGWSFHVTKTRNGRHLL